MVEKSTDKEAMMATLKEIKSQVAQLSSSELSEFREWFSKFDAAAWDKQLEHGSSAELLETRQDMTNGNVFRESAEAHVKRVT